MKLTRAQKLARALRRHQRKLEQARAAFAAADRAMLAALRAGARPGVRYNLGGQDYCLNDAAELLRARGAIYRPARLARYTLDPIKAKDEKG